MPRAILGGWQTAALAAVRSGFPYHVVTGTTLSPTDGFLLNNRPGINPGVEPVLAERVPVPGGYRLLNPAAFNLQGPTIGALGRNSLAGPGAMNFDWSLAKSFSLPWLGESGRLQFRADFFNVLNHANLRNPANIIGNPRTPVDGFGNALFGPGIGSEDPFPALAPLGESARHVQLQIKLHF